MEDAKNFWRSQDEPTWSKVRKGIAKMSRSTGYGLYPFTVDGIDVMRKENWDTKVGTRTSIYTNKETGVQVSYSFSRIRWYDMSNPEEHKTYWRQRAAVKAAFVRSMGWRK